ncbi:MAG: JAB domain-containing protein [Erysipelotrichaceae bacterium]|nr:JAB domain-containing protein [Erysipelotrichaceae bacterium]
MMKKMPVSERPREKALRYGIERLSNRELLALLIRHGTSGCSALDIADDLLKNGLLSLSRMKMKDLTAIRGIKEVKALELLAWFELSCRIACENIMEKDVVENPEALIQWCMLELGSLQQEHFMAVFLNPRNEVISYKVLFTGTVDMSVVHPREVFKEAIDVCCSKLLVVHNHPSGYLEPSAADLMMTENLCNAGKMMKIPVVDHLIVSDTEYFSFREHGILY